MTLSATLATMAAMLAVCVAALCHWLSVAPGWRDVRLFSYVALSAAVYSALNIPSNLGVEGSRTLLCARVQLLVAGVHVVAWLRYASVHLGFTRPRWERWYERALLVACASAIVPGLAYRGGGRTRAFTPLGFVYAEAIPTAWGLLLFAALVAVFALLAVRYWLAWRRGVPYAAVHCVGLCVFLLMGANDALAVSSLAEMPHLLEVGCVVPVGAVAYSLVARFGADAHDLARLRADLETIVDERTRELACAVDALHRSEKLAALGQFAAGVAHEVNNPTAVVTSNLQYLAEAIERGPTLPADARSCVADSLAATARIARVARQLLDAGRLAASTPACECVSVAAAVGESVRAAQARCGAHVRFAASISPGLCARAQQDALVQVLVNLLVNGGQAIPEGRADARVTVCAECDGRVRIAVEDNGTGMSEETLARAFEPFFSTKPFGDGTGLGLAVSRGLVEGLGGDLRLSSRLGEGTRAVIELPEWERTDAPPAARLAEDTLRQAVRT
jgi:signal transduction histidine kinase